ncbi:hypothetical protein BT69DRAFT_359111 [Atractiella rhizophila]|nr:hypothetical protein BT69DRAFT_359111 [Atractiella rhizophila]
MESQRDFRKSTSSWAKQDVQAAINSRSPAGRMDGATATVDGESFLFTGFKSTFEESPSLGFPTPTPTTPSSFRSRSSSSGSSSPVPLAVPHMSTYPLSYAAPYSGSTPTVASVASSRTSISTNRSMTPTRELTSPGSRTVMMPMKGGTKTRVSMRTTSPTGSISSMGGSANGLNMTYNSKQSFDGEVKTPTVDRYYHNTSPTSPTGSQLPYVSSMRNSPPAGKVVAGDGYYTPSHSQSPSISSMASSKSSARSTTPTLQNATMSSSTLSHRTMSSTTSASSNSHGPTPHSHDKRPKTDFEPAFDPRRAMARSKSHDLLNAAHGLTNPPPSDMYRPASSIAYSNGTDHQYFHHSHRPTPSGSSVAPLPNATATRPESGYSDGSEDDGSANATPRGSVAFGFGQSNRNSVASVLDLMNGGQGKDEEEESSTRVDFFAPKLNLELDFGGLSLGWDDDKSDNKGLMTPKAKEGNPIGPTSTSIQSNESSSGLKRGASVKRRPTVKATGASIGHTSTPSTASTVSTFLGTGEKGKGSARPSDPTEYRSTRSRGYSSGASSLLDLKLPSESRDDDLWSLDLFDNKKSANGTVKVKSPTSRIPVPKIPEGVYDNPSASLSHSRSSSETPKSSLSHETSTNFTVDQMTNRPPAEAERPDSRASLRSAFMIKTTSATSAETATMSRNGHKPLDRSRTPSLSSLLSLSRLTKQDPASSMMNGNSNGSPATVDTRSINSSNSSLSPSRSTEGTATTKTNFFSKISSNALTKRRKSGTSMISISDSYTGDDASGSSRDAHPSDKSTFSRQNLKASIKKFTLEPPTPLNLVRPKSPGAGLSLNKSLPPTPTPIHDQGDREDEDKGKERGGLKRGLSRMRKKSENVLGGLKNAAVAAAAAAANATNSNQPEAMPPRPKTPDHLSQFPMGKKAFSKSSTNLESGVAAEDKERPPLREIKTSAASVVSSIGKAGSKAVKAVRKNSLGLERQMRESQNAP